MKPLLGDAGAMIVVRGDCGARIVIGERTAVVVREARGVIGPLRRSCAKSAELPLNCEYASSALVAETAAGAAVCSRSP